MQGSTFSAKDNGTLTRTFSPPRPASSTLTCSQRSPARTVAAETAKNNTKRQPTRGLNPSTHSPRFMLVASSLSDLSLACRGGPSRPSRLPHGPPVFLLREQRRAVGAPFGAAGNGEFTQVSASLTNGSTPPKVPAIFSNLLV